MVIERRCKVGADLRIGWAELDRPPQRCQSFRRLAAGTQHVAEIPVDFGRRRGEIDGPPELTLRVIDVASRRMREAESVVNISGGGHPGERALEMLDSGRHVAFLEQHVRQVVVCSRHVRLQLQRLLKLTDRLVKPTGCREGDPEIVVDVGIGRQRLLVDCTLKLIDRRRGLPLVEEQIRERVACRNHVRLQFQRLLARRDRLVDPLRFSKRGGKVVVRRRVIRIVGDGAPVVHDRFVYPVIRVKRQAKVRFGDGAHFAG